MQTTTLERSTPWAHAFDSAGNHFYVRPADGNLRKQPQ
jgi:hypothetical protein